MCQVTTMIGSIKNTLGETGKNKGVQMCQVTTMIGSIKNTLGETGKNKGKILTIKCCWVVDCTCQGDSFSKEDGVILCLTHGKYV